MAHKISAASVEKNKDKWTQNLTRFQDINKKRGNIEVEEKPLDERSRMPLTKHVIGRYIFLCSTIKEKKSRTNTVAKEIVNLWERNLNFPCLSVQAITARIEKLILSYESCRKCGKMFEQQNNLFDVTKVEGTWLSQEDRSLYKIQKESNGKLGYSSVSMAGTSSIHPSKRVVNKEGKSFSEESSDITMCSNDFESSGSEAEINDEQFKEKRKTYQKGKFAANLVSSAGVSTSKAAKICQKLSEDGLDVPSPNQSTVYRSTMKKGRMVKNDMIENLHKEQWSLHFDGKKINHIDYQVVVLKNERTEIKLAVLKLEDGKAENIALGIEKCY